MSEGSGAPRWLTTRITHLEMPAPPARRQGAPLGSNIAVMRVENIPLPFYRFLYEQVGRSHHWSLRRNIDDKILGGIVHAPQVAISVLYVGGAPAGFFELDLSQAPADVEIVYFGLVPEFQGRGLGAFFLSEAIFAAWESGPAKVTIHTNSLDSPRALHLYQKAGFVPVGWSEENVEAWD